MSVQLSRALPVTRAAMHRYVGHDPGRRAKGLRGWGREGRPCAAAALAPIRDAASALGASPQEAEILTVETFAHASGLLLLLHTGRIRMFGASAEALMARYLAERIARLRRTGSTAGE